MKEHIVSLLMKVVSLKKEEIENLVEAPQNKDFGDYAFPCFSLTKVLKKSPNEIAKDIEKKLMKSKEVEKIVTVGSYVNFYLNKKYLAENTLKEILKKKDKYGSMEISKERVMVEFSQANTHKAFHIGHVRGTSLGESIARILEFGGNKVVRANYQGDTGMHVAQWIWCYNKYHVKEKLKKDETWVAGIYVESVSRLNENEKFKEEVEEINRKLDSKEDKKLNGLWEQTRELSLESFEPIYKELNTKFDNYFYESEVEDRAKDISKELLNKKIAELSEKAVIMDLEKFNLGIWVLLRSDGTVLYSAKDIALAEMKFNKYKIDKSIYVVGSAQQLHVYQLFKTLELMKFKQAEKCRYVPITEVRLPEGKMSSRTGQNILYSAFKDELVEYAKMEIQNREKVSGKELNTRALAISIASLKYVMLKQDVNKAIVFNKKEALQFEGNTGPYLLYTYARAKSILKKAKSKEKKLVFGDIDEKERNLISKLALFPEIALSSYNNLAPNVIANYCYELAQIFNEFYHSEKVIGSTNEIFRLSLVECSAQVLKNGLSLLGINVIEKM